MHLKQHQFRDKTFFMKHPAVLYNMFIKYYRNLIIYFENNI